jgi:HemY protein
MKWLVIFLVALAVAVVLGLYAHQDVGYVLIGRGYTTVEMSLTLFVLLAVVLFATGYAVLRMFAGTWRLPNQLATWRQHRRVEKARQSANRGLVELAQGNWAQAERALLRYARFSETPLLNYLSAARAAQKQNAPERRDNYLAAAHTSARDADFAVELTQAELQLAHGQDEHALATLVHLQSIAPKHPHVLYLLSRLYQRLRSWGDLKTLLPALKKQKVMDTAALRELDKIVQLHLLQLAAQKNKPDLLEGSWKHVPKELRTDPELVSCYASNLIAQGQHDDAEILLREAIRQDWNANLINLYGQVHSTKPEQTLATAEAWLKGRENNAALLLTLGRLAARCELWGKARSYLEASVGAQPSVAGYRELGLLLEKMQEPRAAADCFRQGLMLVEDPAVAPRPHTSVIGKLEGV